MVDQVGNSEELPRRKFIKQCVVAGVTLYTAPLVLSLNEAVAQASNSSQVLGYKAPKFRLDGIAKVTGQKVYGRDFRAQDMAGWPKEQAYGFVIRATKVDHTFSHVDLTDIPENAQPFKVILAEDLVKQKLELPPFFGNDMLVAKNAAPQYYGHAVAILLFENFDQFKEAKLKLQFNDNVVRYGKSTKPFTSNPYAAWRIVREEGKQGASGKDKYSPLQDGLFFPSYQRRMPVWKGDPNQAGSVSERGLYYGNEVQQKMQKNADDWLIIDEQYTSQSVDPMMMEPEAFNGFWEKATKTLHVVATSQSPHDYQEQVAEILAHSKMGHSIKNIVVHSAYVGGAFGAKDHSIFPYYGTIAALFSEGRPLYLANDRFEQFQAGLKRHPFIMDNKLAFDKKTGQLQGLHSKMNLDGGGRSNFSSAIAMVGASAIQGIYYLPRNDIQATAHQSNNVDCGSMRGFGTLQTMSSMEMMLNEAAQKLNMDPIELREKNIMKTGFRNTQGAIPNGELRYGEILEKAKQHTMWTQRAARKQEFEKNNPHMLFGTGFGIATKDYGTGAAAPSSAVRISPEGKIELDIVFMEMGTGTQTSQAVSVGKFLGSTAHQVNLAKMDSWAALKQFQTDNPYITSQARQDEMAQNPQWTPVVAMASSASMSSYFQTHTSHGAARVLYRYGLWPAAQHIWSGSTEKVANKRISFKDIELAKWKDEMLTMPGKPSLPLAQLAAKAHELGLVTGVMTHAFNRWSWADAQFSILGNKETLELDGLALQYGNGADKRRKNLMKSHGYHLINRQKMNYPATAMNNAMVTYYAPCATLVDVAVNKGNGKVAVVKTHSWLDCGTPLVSKLVEGQIEGGVAMGIGHALFEELPLGEEGPGTGQWNLNRYDLAKGKDVGVWQHTHTLLEPLNENTPSKGIGEVVMIPVVPAIAEAVYQATNVRFRSLPITAKKVKEALQS